MPTWLVNSYGYPNPFQSTRSATGAWEMFESFRHHSSYQSLKAYWARHRQRPIHSHTVESWKSTFEEFGLLYVLSGHDEVIITPGGEQLAAAAAANDKQEFAWVGINLLLRYPLRGSARQSRGVAFDASDLLLYWFVLATFLDLETISQAELNRVLCLVFRRDDAVSAIDLIRQLRVATANINQYPDQTEGRTGAVYNSINQVMVHGSLNHMLFTSERQTGRYFNDIVENRWQLHAEYRDIVALALGAQAQPVLPGCGATLPLIQRMPAVQAFANEQAYFDHLGAPVSSFATAQQRAQGNAAPAVQYGDEIIYFLTADRHFTRIDTLQIRGSIQILCVLAEHQRVILSDEIGFTYLVENKTLSQGEVLIRLRRARPILDPDFVRILF